MARKETVEEFFDEEEVQGGEVLEQLENRAEAMYRLAMEDDRESDTLRLNFESLNVNIERHCYNLVSTGTYKGSLKKQLKIIQLKKEARAAQIVCEFLDNLKQGESARDAKYRQGLVLQDEKYQGYCFEEADLVEIIEVVETVYLAYQQKAMLMLGMQKSINNLK